MDARRDRLQTEYEEAMQGVRIELFLYYSEWLRVVCDLELARLGLTWKHERVRAFLGRCFPPRPTLDAADEATLEALLEKLRAL